MSSDTPESTPENTINTSELFSGVAAEAGTVEAPTEPAFTPNIRGKLDKFGVAMGTGRRKTSVARVRLTPNGTGKFTINGRELNEFFCTEKGRETVVAPLKAVELLDKLDVWVRVDGGGITGQAGAILLGISRALQAINPDLHSRLSDLGYLTRDGRMVERKKYGHKKARRSFQFSKR